MCCLHHAWLQEAAASGVAILFIPSMVSDSWPAIVTPLPKTLGEVFSLPIRCLLPVFPHLLKASGGRLSKLIQENRHGDRIRDGGSAPRVNPGLTTTELKRTVVKTVLNVPYGEKASTVCITTDNQKIYCHAFCSSSRVVSKQRQSLPLGELRFGCPKIGDHPLRG